MSASVGPDIVKNNLVFNLDASNVQSYPATGNTWYDISGRNRNATLYNSPTFRNENGGILSFSDTSFQYGETAVAEDINRWTAECWVRITKSLSGKPTSIITGQYDLASKLNFSLGTNESPSFFRISAGFFDGGWRIAPGFAPTLFKWYHFAGTYDGARVAFFVNGLLYSSLNYVGTPQSGGTFRICRRWDESASNAINFLNGDVGTIRVYNVALSPTQILQNYNATASRFEIL
jgi:hypothetical protein